MAGAIPGWLIAWVLARSLGLVGAPNPQPSTADLVDVLVGALFCSAVATVAWNTGVARLGIQTGAIWQNTVPVFAVLITVVFFGLVPSAAQVLGRAVVLAGGLWMQWQKRARGGA
jgi:drug/metabolite transporter (DMT)-like permease